jgi:hypothetical protein
MPLFVYVVLASAFVPVIVGLIRFNKHDTGGRILLMLVSANAIQMSAAYTLAMMKIPNLWFVNLYRPIELVLIALAFVAMLEGRLARRVILLCAVLYVLIWIADKFTLDVSGELNTRMAMLSRIIAIIMSIVALYAGSGALDTRFAERTLTWVGAAVLLYSSGTLLVLGFGNQLIASGREAFVQAWHINWTLLLVANIFYTKGLLCRSHRQI